MPSKTTLLVGFDSAWTPTNSGAIVGVLRDDDGTYTELGLPLVVNYSKAGDVIDDWKREHDPTFSIVLLDQPTIVQNEGGQRPVESIVSSPVGRRYGGVQPANTSKIEMFGSDAPVWGFLNRFGGAADPREPVPSTCVLETYPVLALIALGWVLPDTSRPTGRLPKYNPGRRKPFSISDWGFVCERVAGELAVLGLPVLSRLIADFGHFITPTKSDQDCLDACVCLIVALHLADKRECLMVGDTATGYIVVPSGNVLRLELDARCDSAGMLRKDWVCSFVLRTDS